VSDVSPDIQFPQTSTRDPGEVAARLQAWLATQLPDGYEPRVTDLEIPSTNGLSSETVLFDVSWDAGKHAESLVARIAPDASAVPVFPRYDLPQQFHVMQLVAARCSVPVPRVRWCEPDPAPLGSPFFVMERVDGQVPPDILPYNFGSWLSEGTPEQLSRFQDATIGVLAALHGIEAAPDVFDFLELERPEPTALARHVGDQRSYYEWVVADGKRSPLLEAGFDWLRAHWPDDEGETAFSWGDSRIGNILYRDFTPVAVLDWEMAGLAPREVDLGWLVFMHRFFEDVAETYGLPGMPNLLRRDDVAATYESLTGHTPRDLDFYTMYAATRHGIIMSRIARRSIHFGEATAPQDVDDMISHRKILEQMLEGAYWTTGSTSDP
jgi:aminoglycoside phosphotransferase (APT) family kinase protein